MGGGWWVVLPSSWQHRSHPPTESTTGNLPRPSLPYAGSAEAIRRRHLRLSVSAGHNGDGEGGGGCGTEGRKGGGGHFGGCVGGGGDARSSSRLLPSLAFPDSPMPSYSFSSSSVTSTGHWCDPTSPRHASSVVITAHHVGGYHTHPIMPILRRGTLYRPWMPQECFLRQSEHPFSLWMGVCVCVIIRTHIACH